MKRLRILVADDEQGIRDLIRDTLSRRGHEVICASNGVETIARLAREHADVLFLDIRMPGGDGLTALREITRMRPSLPVVMITGCGDQDLITSSVTGGASLCLMKPFSMRDVIGVLEVLEVLDVVEEAA